MNNRSNFKFEINPNKLNERLEQITLYLEENNFRNALVNGECCYLHIPTERELKLGTRPKCISFNIEANEASVTAWIYDFLYPSDFNINSLMININLDNDKAMSLEGMYASAAKKQFAKKVRKIKKILTL